MRVFVLVNCLTILLFGNACSNSKVHSIDTSNMAKYTNSKFSIFYPYAWQVDSSQTLGNVLVLHSPLRDEQDDFRESISIEYIFLGVNTQTINVEEFVVNKLPNVSLKSVDTINKKQQYTKFVFETESSVEKLQIIQYAFLKNRYLYLLSFTQRKDDTMLEYIAISIMETFQLHI